MSLEVYQTFVPRLDESMIRATIGPISVEKVVTCKLDWSYVHLTADAHRKDVYLEVVRLCL